MNYYYIFLSLMLLVIAYMAFEAGWLEVKRVRFSDAKKGLKIIHLSDIHISKLRVKADSIIQVLEREKPDLVIITGDYIEKNKHIPKFLELLQKITAVASCYFCLGNHDYKVFKRDRPGLCSFIEKIEKKGSVALHNNSVCIEKNGKKYNLIGIADKRSGYTDVSKALSGCSKDAFLNIAFSHNPDIIFDIPNEKVDYLFCGHFHGGQIWAPFDLEFKMLRDEKLCKIGIKRGLHKLNGIELYINRGLGNVCIPLRFLSRPEITVYYFP